MANQISQQQHLLESGELHFKFDKATGLHAIIAIHSTKLGPALGGCRCIEYDSFGDALHDAIRLAKGMSYKTAVSGLALGGGKAVLLKPKQIADREAYFQAFGRFVEHLGGRYITAVDSGTTLNDMDLVAKTTSHVVSRDTDGDPSNCTALGVRRGIEAGAKFYLNRSDLDGLHIAIQGVGKVGRLLVRELHERGVKITVADTNAEAIQRCVDEYQVNVVSLDKIMTIPCDVFAPCALGGILNDKTIPLLNTQMVIGSANNQLGSPEHAIALFDRGIHYAPDYVVNAGGIIHCAAYYTDMSIEESQQKIIDIYDNLLRIFDRARTENSSPAQIADVVAQELLTEA